MVDLLTLSAFGLDSLTIHCIKITLPPLPVWLCKHTFGTACCRYLRTNPTWWCIRSMCTDRTLNLLSASIAASHLPTHHTSRSIIASMQALSPSSVVTVKSASLSRCISSSISGNNNSVYLEVIRLSPLFLYPLEIQYLS